jgi:hypothetical protein
VNNSDSGVGILLFPGLHVVLMLLKQPSVLVSFCIPHLNNIFTQFITEINLL